MQILQFQRQVVTTLLLILSGVVSQQVILSINDNATSVSVESVGLTHAHLNESVIQALNSCQSRELLSGTRHRLLTSGFRNEEDCGAESANDMFQAAVYDYSHGRTLLFNGDIFDPTAVSTSDVNIQPLPNAEELAEAASIASIQPNETVQGGMPPVITRDFANGTSHRILNIAITSPKSSRMVHVNMNNRSVEFTSSSEERVQACTAPAPASDSSLIAVSGTSNFVITQSGNQLWTFQAITPKGSSGTKGSGIELRNVKYKGKTVLYRAHVPILNVQYDQPTSSCGPNYRDWQWQEVPFKCDGSDVAPGFRLCKSPAKSILDSPYTDGGNFIGVAVYVEGQEVVLKSQMSASWYRYVSEWRFHVDGTIRPRFGFAAVYQYPYCVCQVHHHHVYWRLDFDIETSGNNLVREFNNPPLFPPSNYHDKVYEIRRPKDARRKRHWEISNTQSGRTYALNPGPNDGNSDSFGIGDLWVLKYHPNELDDGVSVTSADAATTMAHIDKFINGELVKNQDVVVWYGAHFMHDHSHMEGASHVVGPDIHPVKW